MCGIISYIGKRRAAPLLLDSLKKLEYRGYDSAGLAVLDGGEVNSAKEKGRIEDLRQSLLEFPEGTVGIAHTRWATHGIPSRENAHPHSDCTGNIWVVHNGIIENYLQLKEELEGKGHKFISETDTEVTAHLIEEFKKNLSFPEAVKKALQKIKGAFALVILSKDEPDKIIAARLSSPLTIGVGRGEFFITSDAAAIVGHTREIINLDDYEMAVIERNHYEISSINSNQILDKKIESIDWDVSEAEKGGYEHFMLKEICSQPESLKNTLRGRLFSDEGNAALGGLKNMEDRLQKISRLIITACGTARFAGLVGEYMFEEYAGIPAEVEYASEFRYRKSPLNKEEDAVLAISQSGETADTLAAIKEAKQKRVLTLGVVNTVGSAIARDTEAGVYNHIGPEIGVASTKAFTSQLVVLSLMSLLLGRQRGMSLVTGQRIADELLKLPQLTSLIIRNKEDIKIIADKYKHFKNFFFLGRKYNYPIACEGALKLKEIAYVFTEGIAGGEMKHGPIALIDENILSIFIVPRDSVYEKNISNMQEIKARGGKILAIATEGDEDICKLADDVIFIPKTLEMLTPVLSVIPLQLFAYYFAYNLGLDIDKPRNLAKSVTVE